MRTTRLRLRQLSLVSGACTAASPAGPGSSSRSRRRVGLSLTLLFTIVPQIDPAYQNRSLHVAKETAGALVLLLVAALLFGRFNRSGRLSDLLALAGVVVLAGKNLVFSVLGAILLETSGGLTTWRTTGAGMLGARCSLPPRWRRNASCGTGGGRSC